MPFKFSQEQFDEASSSNESREFTPVPDGKYCVSLLQIDDEQRTSKAGNEIDYLKVQLRYEGGQYNNRREFDDLVYENSGSEAQGRIGRKRIAQLWSALGGSGIPGLDGFLSKVGNKFELVIKTKPSKDPQWGPSRDFYFNPCSSNCGDCSSSCEASPPSDGGGDIWS